MLRRGVTSKVEIETPELDEVGHRFWVVVAICLSMALLMVTYRLYFGETSQAKLEQLERELAEQVERNQAIAQVNRELTIEIEALKNGNTEIETRAREDLGLVKPDEKFYVISE